MEKEDNPKIIYKRSLDSLGVSFEPVFIAKGMEGGLADLVTSAQNDMQEACWLYVHDDEKWYNLASGLFSMKEGQGRYIESVDCTDIPVSAGKRTHCHTHHKKVLEKALYDFIKNNPQYNSPLAAGITSPSGQAFWNQGFAALILPSTNDIAAFIDYKCNPEGEGMDFCVVSPLAIAQIDVDPILINLGAVERYEELIYDIRKIILSELETAVIKPPAVELAEETCRRLNTIPGLRIKIKEHQ